MLYLDFHHHTIFVRCNESSLLRKLKEEFHFFVTQGVASPEVTIDLKLEKVPALPELVAHKILEHAVIYREGARKFVDYFGSALIIENKIEKTVEIFSQDLDRLYELSFLTIHSYLGQKLELDGLCRLHAVAVSLQKNSAIVMLPSKGGKSTLLKTLLEAPELKVISDDMPLCDLKGRIHPFPSKISLHEVPQSGVLSTLQWHEFKRHHYPPKWTASLAQLNDRLDVTPEENKNFLIAGYRLSKGPSRLHEVSKFKMLRPLAEHMIIGLGLPQIIELFLEFKVTDLFKLARHVFARSVCAWNLVRKARCFYLYMGPDNTNTAHLITDLLYDNQNS